MSTSVERYCPPLLPAVVSLYATPYPPVSKFSASIVPGTDAATPLYAPGVPVGGVGLEWGLIVVVPEMVTTPVAGRRRSRIIRNRQFEVEGARRTVGVGRCRSSRRDASSVAKIPVIARDRSCRRNRFAAVDAHRRTRGSRIGAAGVGDRPDRHRLRRALSAFIVRADDDRVDAARERQRNRATARLRSSRRHTIVGAHAVDRDGVTGHDRNGGAIFIPDEVGLSESGKRGEQSNGDEC